MPRTMYYAQKHNSKILFKMAIDKTSSANGQRYSTNE